MTESILLHSENHTICEYSNKELYKYLFKPNGGRLDMAGIKVTEIAKNGVANAVKSRPEIDESYKKLIKEANKKIEEDRYYYARSYKKASTYLAGKPEA